MQNTLNDFESGRASRERLSALVDGELEASMIGVACSQWRVDADTRSAWHAYQVIGDALRSDDLVRTAARDEDFLVGLRKRLAVEPVVLAPEPLPVPFSAAAGADADVDEPRIAVDRAVMGRSARRAWRTPGAIAAGFVVVAGAVMVTRAPVTVGPVASVAMTTASSPRSLAKAPTAEQVLASGQEARNANLDRYLSAHKQFAGSSALGVTPYLRDASVEIQGR